MSKFTLSSLACALLLAGCAPEKPLISQDEIQAAHQTGNLEAAYDQFSARLLTIKDPSSPEAQKAQAEVKMLGQELAQKQEQTIRGDLSQYATASGLIPLPLLDAMSGKLAKMERWDKPRFEKLKAEIADDKQKTQARIDELQQSRTQLGDTEMARRMGVLADLAQLTGDDHYNKEKADILDILHKRADSAMKAEKYGDAKQALLQLQQINPQDSQVQSQLIQTDAKLFEKKFWDALGEGKLDDAYTQFMTIAQTAQFPEVLKRLSKSSNDMVDYFEAQAAAATADNHLGEAYKLFKQARDIRSKLNSGTMKVLPQEQTFCDRMFERYLIANKRALPGLALAYLKIIEEFNPDYSNLRGLLRTTSDATLAKAVRKVSTAAFTSDEGKGEFGSAVAAKVTQRLFDKIPNDLKIIERDQFQAILREKEIGAASSKSELVSADYLIQGKILEARVDTSEEKGKKIMRVVTDSTIQPNPAYAQWLTLPEDKRKNLPEPDKTISVDKKEDVSINLNIVRKVGILSASYRLVEASTGKVIATGSETAKEENHDEGNEGVELGNYRMPFKLPSLPSDTEIYDHLVGKISEAIGDKLVQQMQNADTRYVQLSQRYADEGDYVAAGEQAAYAYVIAREKKQELATLMSNMTKYAASAQP